MRFYLKYLLGGLAIISLTLPAMARAEHAEHMDLNLQQTIMVGTTQVPAGSYQLKADESKTDMTIMQYGKVVADVQGHWVKLPKKANDSEVSYDHNRMTQVQFQGQNEAFHVG